MKRNLLILLSLLFILTQCKPLSDDEEAALYNKEMKRIAAKFGSELKSVMERELKEGGPMQAVTVCGDTAQILTLNFSEVHGLEIKRVSMRTRNKLNNPDDFEMGILEEFQKISDRGEVFDTLEVAKLYWKDGVKHVRYMQPIVAQGVCLTCHGREDQLTDEVKEYLKKKYPDDNATGFGIGDLRGAISIMKEID